MWVWWCCFHSASDTYYWLENSFVEWKSTPTTLSYRLHSLPATLGSGARVSSVLVRYRTVNGDGTFGRFIPDRVFSVPFNSERQLTRLSVDTKYQIQAVLNTSPPGDLNPSLNLSAYTSPAGMFCLPLDL